MRSLARASAAAATLRPALALRLLPVAVLVGSAWALAWELNGSFAASDWLPYAVLGALVVAAVLLSGAAARPGRAAAGGAAFLLALAGWDAISIGWSPVPSLARDEALLVVLYAVALAVPLVTLRTDAERLAAAALAVAGLGSLAVAAAVELRVTDRAAELYSYGRLDYPITYPNGQAALGLIGFWPAVWLAAERRLPALARALALGLAVSMLCVEILAQSKGGIVGLAVSAIIFFAVCPARLRALLPTLVAVGAAGAGAVTLTEPFRASDAELAAAVHEAGSLTLWLSLAGAGVGLVYAAADRRVEVGAALRRAAGFVALAGLVAGIGAGSGTFLAVVEKPGAFFEERWEEFKHLPEQQREGVSHLASLGSNRYDFWRVTLGEFERHPVAGIGARGFGSAYLVEGRSEETPERAHSLEMDVIAETGIVGLLLLVVAGGLLAGALWRRARSSLAGGALLAAGAYWAAHTAVDWIWTIPAIGVPAFLLIGIGASPGEHRPLRAAAAVPVGIAAALLALVAFAPPWLSARFVAHAFERPGEVPSALRWARRLDPLSTDPLVAEAEIVGPPASIAPLERAVAKQPRRPDLRYLLGLAYLAANRRREARAQLREALRLYPRDHLAAEALERAGGRP